MKMKRVILAALVMVLAFSLIPVNAEAASKKTKLNMTKVTLTEGGSVWLSLENAPKKKKITWSSNKKKVAIVNEYGEVIAKKKGTAKITAKVGGKKYTCTVKVIKKNASDVKALKKIINAQQKQGVDMSAFKNLNADCYTWNSKGRLTNIFWGYSGLKGSISFAGLTELKGVHCGFNELTNLDVSKNKKLEILQCPDNKLKSLKIQNNTKLKELNCTNNKLSALDIQNNVNLEILYCFNNKLSNLNIQNNTKLKELYCANNQLSVLDVSANTELTILDCAGNKLSSLDVSKNTELTSLDCSQNKISTLDLTNNKKLTNLLYDDEVEVTGYDE